MDGPGGKWTVQLGESGRSWVKVDGPKGHKVDGLRKLTVQNTKVDGPQRMTLGGIHFFAKICYVLLPC